MEADALKNEVQKHVVEGRQMMWIRIIRMMIESRGSRGRREVSA